MCATNSIPLGATFLPRDTVNYKLRTNTEGRRGARTSGCYLNVMAWDAVMLTRSAEAHDIALYHPVLAAYPHVKFSNYGYRMWTQYANAAVPEVQNGKLNYKYGSGAVNGNQISVPLYGSLSVLSANALVATSTTGLSASNYNESSPFNAMVWCAPVC